jgi:adenylate kinase
MKRVYPSFPMTHIHDLPNVLAEVDAFRKKMAEHFITFDPGDVDEKLLADAALAAVKEGLTAIEVPELPGKGAKGKAKSPTRLKIADILSILPDIDGQIYSRDFLLVRQSDMVVSYIPELPGREGGSGKPGLSSGVERELQHAHDHGRETYVIWKPKKDPSPFVTQTATKVFRTTDEALAYFEERGYLRAHTLFGG